MTKKKPHALTWAKIDAALKAGEIPGVPEGTDLDEFLWQTAPESRAEVEARSPGRAFRPAAWAERARADVKRPLTDGEFKAAIAASSSIPGIKAEDVILGPRRSELIEDGSLMDISEMAREAGFTTSVAMTRAAWYRHVRVPDGDDSGQDPKGRLWDVVWMAACHARGAGMPCVSPHGIGVPAGGRLEDGSGRITFRLITSKAGDDGTKLPEAVETKLDLVLEGDDNLEPVATIALEGED